MRYFLAIMMILISGPVLAQRPPQQPQEPNCYPYYQLPNQVDITPLLSDRDGDMWIKVRVIPNGKIILGYRTKSSRFDQFCEVIDGKTNPET